MRAIAAAFVLAATLLCAGCASVTQGMTHSLRVEAATDKGELIPDAECTMRNDDNSLAARSGESVTVRRSAKDLSVSCTRQGLPEATARLVSRANMGLAGNIILGGAIGALVDHSNGSAYTYPTWVRLVFGHYAVFDRRDEQAGVPLVYAGPNALPQALVAATPSPPLPAPASVAAPVAAPVAVAAPVPFAAPVAAPVPVPAPVQASAQAAPVVASAPTRPDAPVVPPGPAGAIARGNTYDYRVTDRTTGGRQTVVLRAERVDSGEVSFNSGARVENMAGDVIRMNAALLGELDLVTPKGGWLPEGKVRTGTWSIRGDSLVPGSGRQYDLVASTEEEQMVDTAAGSLPARRIALRGWLRHAGAGHVPATARYEGAVWVSPKLGRVVRFEAKSRASGGTGSSFFLIDESAELVRIGAD